jgi:hypothetical protein
MTYHTDKNTHWYYFVDAVQFLTAQATEALRGTGIERSTRKSRKSDGQPDCLPTSGH